jgi:hypothetical protein
LRASGLSLDTAELEGCYAAAWQGLYGVTLEGRQIENPLGWLTLVTYRRAIEELRAPRRRDAELGAATGVEADLAAALDDRDRLHQLIEGMRGRLDAREREAAALCYLHGYTREQAARQMGISATRMRKLMDGRGGAQKGVAAKVGELVETIEAGAFCQQQASLMRALAYGVLDPRGERYGLAVAHRRRCPACRRYVASLRGLAATLPPVLLRDVLHAAKLAGLAGAGHHLVAAHGAGTAGQAGNGHAHSAGAGGAAAPAAPLAGGSALGVSTLGSGGAVGGGWLLGSGGLGAKLAATCLLALGVGAGCVALRDATRGRSPSRTQHSRARAAPLSATTSAGAAAASSPRAGAGARSAAAARAGASVASGSQQAAREFGPEQPASAAAPGAQTAQRPSARAASASGGAGAGATPAAQGPASSAAAAQREFAPG